MSAEDQCAVRHLVGVRIAGNFHIVRFGAGLPDEQEIISADVRHVHRVAQRGHVRFVLDADHLRYVCRAHRERSHKRAKHARIESPPP